MIFTDPDQFLGDFPVLEHLKIGMCIFIRKKIILTCPWILSHGFFMSAYAFYLVKYSRMRRCGSFTSSLKISIYIENFFKSSIFQKCSIKSKWLKIFKGSITFSYSFIYRKIWKIGNWFIFLVKNSEFFANICICKIQ